MSQIPTFNRMKNKLSNKQFSAITGPSGETPFEFGVRTGLFQDSIGQTAEQIKSLRLSRLSTQQEIETFERKERIKKMRKKQTKTKPGVASKVVIGLSDLFIKAGLKSGELLGKGLLSLTKKIVDMSVKELETERIALTDLLKNGLSKNSKTHQKQIKTQLKRINRELENESDDELQSYIDENFGPDFLDISSI